MTWALRRAGRGDLDAIMAIETSTFVNDAWPASAMRSDLASRHCYYLVAFDDARPDAVEGYAGLLAPKGSGDADIQTIAVSLAARRTGLGRMLMLALIAEARDRGARNVFLEVRADNPAARHLYETLGFEEIAVRPRYYQPDGVDAVIMRLTLGMAAEAGADSSGNSAAEATA